MTTHGTLTPLQRSALAAAVRLACSAGRLPAPAEIAEAAGLPSAVHAERTLAALARKGWVRRDGHGAYAVLGLEVRIGPTRDGAWLRAALAEGGGR